MQEGLLARSLSFQFADEACSLEDLLDYNIFPKPLSSTWFRIYVTSISLLENLFLRDTGANRLLALLENMQLRAVTVPEDEAAWPCNSDRA